MKESGQGDAHARRKALFVITKSNFGGAQRYVYDLATSLPKETFEVAVAFGAAPGKDGGGRLADMLAGAGIRTILIPELVRDVKAGTDFAALQALIRLFKTEKPDVVHLNSSKAGGIGSMAGRIAGVKKIVFTAHGWPFWEDRNPIAKALIYFFSYVTVAFSHATICISEYDKKGIGWMPFVKRKIAVIHNGIDEIAFLSREDARDFLFPAELQAKHQNDFWLLTNGELTHNKNLFFAIDVVAAHNAKSPKKIFYSIMSDGELKSKIQDYIARHNLKETVQLLGFVPDGRIYCKAFDGFFLPSRKEGLPYVLLEAGAAGLPTIASNIGGIPEIIADNESGLLIDPKDSNSTLEKLSRLVENIDLQQKVAKNLHQTVTSEFWLKTMLKSTIDIYIL